MRNENKRVQSQVGKILTQVYLGRRTIRTNMYANLDKNIDSDSVNKREFAAVDHFVQLQLQRNQFDGKLAVIDAL